MPGPSSRDRFLARLQARQGGLAGEVQGLYDQSAAAEEEVRREALRQRLAQGPVVDPAVEAMQRAGADYDRAVPQQVDPAARAMAREGRGLDTATAAVGSNLVTPNLYAPTVPYQVAPDQGPIRIQVPEDEVPAPVASIPRTADPNATRQERARGAQVRHANSQAQEEVLAPGQSIATDHGSEVIDTDAVAPRPQQAPTGHARAGLNPETGLPVVEYNGQVVDIPVRPDGVVDARAVALGVSNLGLPPEEEARVMRDFERMLTAPRGSGQPTGPTNTASTRVVWEEGGQVSQDNADALAGANEAVDRAREGVNRDALIRTRLAAESNAALAEEQTRLEQERVAQEAEIQKRTDQRIQHLDEAIARISSNRVSQEVAFGAAGGRAVAGLSVIMGSMFRTGDTNQALQVVNSLVDRSMAEQQANMDNERAGVAMEQNLLSQFRTLTGDQRAAQDAVRAGQYGALRARLAAMMNHMEPTQLAMAQELDRALAEQQAAAAAAAGDIARTTIRREVATEVTRRGGPNAAEAVAAGRAAEVGIRDRLRRQADRAEDSAARFEEEGGSAEPDMVFSPDDPEVQAQEMLDESLNPRERARERVRGARGRSGRGGSRERARARVRASFDRRGLTREAWSEAREGLPDFPSAAEQAELASAGRIPPLPPGYMFDPRQNIGDAVELYLRADSGEERTAIRAAQEYAAFVSWGASEIADFRREHGGELTNSEESMVRVRELAATMRAEMIHQMSGAAVSDEERQTYLDRFPEPDEITAANAVGMYDRTLRAWTSFRDIQLRRTRDRLATFGLTTISTEGRAGGRTAQD